MNHSMLRNLLLADGVVLFSSPPSMKRTTPPARSGPRSIEGFMKAPRWNGRSVVERQHSDAQGEQRKHDHGEADEAEADELQDEDQDPSRGVGRRVVLQGALADVLNHRRMSGT